MRLAFRKTVILGTVVFALAQAATAAKANEYYFVLVFGSQTQPKQLRYTHTWATAVRAIGEGPDISRYALEIHTISWLPASGIVKVFRPRPEPGVNATLEQTLAYVEHNHENIIMWGPFIVSRLVYNRFIGVVNQLNSGEVMYRAIDGALNMRISDCIHAVAAVDPQFGRLQYPLIRIGIPASRYVSRRIMFITPYDQHKDDNSWIVYRLGLNRHPITFVSPRQIPYRYCFLCNHPET